LKRAQKAERKLRDALVDLDELRLSAEEGDGEDGEDEDPGGKRRNGERRDSRGRIQAINYKMRALMWAQLARRVAPSNIPAIWQHL
jgi:hypothetical protein